MIRSVHYASSPMLASRAPVWRSRLIVSCFALGFAMLAARSAYVQFFNNSFFRRQGEVRFTRNVLLPASRGRILDRNGLILASSVPSATIWANPEEIDRSDPLVREKLSAIAGLLGMQGAVLDQKLSDDDKNYAVVQRQVDEGVARRIAALGVKGVYQDRDFKRQYPEGESAAHIVGFTSPQDIGQEGIELAFNRELGGQPGSRRVIKDRLGRVVEGIGETIPSVDGKDIRLSIDSKVQFFAYQTLRVAVIANKAKAGSVVVLDTITGEVLALANYPSYDPNQRRNLGTESLRNRALTDVFEPGSTMKPLTVATALELHRIKPGTVFNTHPGSYVTDGAKITDTHDYGSLTVEGIIQKSSNIGAAKISERMSAEEMWTSFTAVGFGRKPQIAFPGVGTGRLRPWASWKRIEQSTMSYGYGLSASLFQIAHSYTVFGHGGRFIPATILKAEGPPVEGIRVFSEANMAAVRRMLQLAAGPDGTGAKAQVDGYSVGGKSGTAHKQEGKGYAAHKYRSWFTGLAPISSPRIVVAVMLDEPSAGQYAGGAVAAPVFSAVVQQTLRSMGVLPDLAVSSSLVIY